MFIFLFIETKLKVNGFYAMDKSNNKITLKWDPPVMAKDVRQYRVGRNIGVYNHLSGFLVTIPVKLWSSS